MPIVQVVIILIVIGVLMWLVNNKIPMDPTYKQIINVVVIIAVVLWILGLFFNIGSLNAIRIGR